MWVESAAVDEYGFTTFVPQQIGVFLNHIYLKADASESMLSVGQIDFSGGTGSVEHIYCF
jgi:hypothetical protein